MLQDFWRWSPDESSAQTFINCQALMRGRRKLRGEEPGERTAREEEEGEVRHEGELNLTSGSVAPQVMIYQAQY